VASYKALVLQHSESGQVYRVFLIKSDPMTGLPHEELLAVQQYVHERYNQSLTPVDLEVIELDRVKERMRSLNRGR